MIRFSCNDSLLNSDLMPPTGGFNFTFTVFFVFFNNFKYQYSMFYESKHYLLICNCRLKHSISFRAALTVGIWNIYSTSDAVSVFPLHCKD